LEGTVDTVKAQADAKSILIRWANSQDHWVRGIVGDVIARKAACTPDSLEAHYKIFLVEKELGAGEATEVAPLVGLEGLDQAETPLVLAEIRDVQHVNALAPGQQLRFNACLTVVFGENGVGKTGYVRILKLVASVRAAEKILPDVRAEAKSAEPPTGTLAYQLDGTETTIDWKGEQGVFPLTRMDIFDSRFSRIHVDEDLTYVYTPGELALFPFVQEAIDKVKTNLEGETQRINVCPNSFLASVERGTRVHPKIEALGASTDIDELRGLAEVRSEEEARLPVLAREIEALKSSSPDVQHRVATIEITFREHLDSFLTGVATFNPAGYKVALEALGVGRKEHEDITSNAFRDERIPGLLRKEWHEFISAGEKYLASLGEGSTFPKSGDQCLYCRQDLQTKALDLVAKYRRYASGESAKKLKEAETQVQQSTKPILDAAIDGNLESISDKIQSSGAQSDVNILTKTHAFLLKLNGFKESLVKREICEWPEWESELEQLRLDLENEIKGLRDTATALKKRTEDKQQELKTRESQVLDIKARLWLKKSLPEIEKYVSDKKWADKGKAHLLRFKGLLRSLTEASKEASQELLNHDFERRFAEECTNLACPKVDLNFPGRQGQVSRKKSVAATYRLDEVLSEGEQKVIALADFLAEAGLKASKAPIVFDDPV